MGDMTDYYTANEIPDEFKSCNNRVPKEFCPLCNIHFRGSRTAHRATTEHQERLPTL